MMTAFLRDRLWTSARERPNTGTVEHKLDSSYFGRSLKIFLTQAPPLARSFCVDALVDVAELTLRFAICSDYNPSMLAEQRPIMTLVLVEDLSLRLMVIFLEAVKRHHP